MKIIKIMEGIEGARCLRRLFTFCDSDHDKKIKVEYNFIITSMVLAVPFFITHLVYVSEKRIYGLS